MMLFGPVPPDFFLEVLSDTPKRNVACAYLRTIFVVRRTAAQLLSWCIVQYNALQSVCGVLLVQE